MVNKERFFKVYSNLPVNLRQEIILVLPEVGPVTWQVGYLEISAETKLGEKILEKLIQLKIV
ncbi:hypothetical protein M1523_01975 [Patescibacteria group bacterium]|nr:hypothetical protein [Patescibacteria group bacterium]